jgi:hypothetical protein
MLYITLRERDKEAEAASLINPGVDCCCTGNIQQNKKKSWITLFCFLKLGTYVTIFNFFFRKNCEKIAVFDSRQR